MSERRKLTLKDIAKELGISISTASRALKAHPDIAEETIQLVKDYAAKHNYVPNIIAVNFRKSRTKNIGLIVPELVHHFFSTVISGAIDEAKKSGYNILVSQSNDHLTDEIIACRTMMASSVDGLLISISNETFEGDHILEFVDEGKPVIQFDKVLEKLSIPQVIVDDFEGGYQATKHLIENGYSRIAHIAGRKDVLNACERLKGYKQALNDHQLPVLEEYIIHCESISEEEGEIFMDRLLALPNPPDAVFCITDLVALGVFKTLKKRAIRIPDQVAIVGFSNWKLAEIVTPSLTSVDQHGYKMGVEAIRMLIQKLDNKEYEIPEKIELKTALVIRESSVKST
ncbi:LacI family DNA-binding transcriptional regulator [Mongoliitalea daihaiensis]|uniref:LacI family DNA-binding transcriptional regulator n=1 Tax=Mongoliitalea daihaiensis TaxID=2782006 RepID=UPI001F214A5D|nr:LacI family DNA-binding transcriptional regulator [Mongoliitalea daihaiensis]UJP64259.1 LacI family DNA-binding transcriptional regulator [Mongoliitalea daihaiensis]